MSSLATNSTRAADARAVVAEDVIEFAEFTDEAPLEGDGTIEQPHSVAAPNWFKGRLQAAQMLDKPDDVVASPGVDEPIAPALDVVSATPSSKSAPSQVRDNERGRRRQRSPRATQQDVAKTPGPKTKQRVASATKRPEKSTEVEAETSLKFDWAYWRQALRKAVIGAYGTSLLIHVLVLVVLSAVIIQQKVVNQGISTQLTEAEGLPEGFDGLVELSLPKAGAELAKSPLMLPTPVADPRLLAAPEVMANAVQSTGKENGGSEFGDSYGFQFKMPTGGKAVVKGSFAAWTVPADPKPREDYLILIRIKLPPGLKTYRVADITGEVIGTDGFRLVVPFDQRRPEATRTERNGKIVPVKQTDLLKIVDGHAQIVVSIPGASALVKDSIKVKSKLLKEEQNLEIEF